MPVRFLLSVLSLAGTLLAFFGQVLLGRTLGPSVRADGYFIGTSWALLLGGLVANAVGIRLVPHLIARHGRPDQSVKDAYLTLCSVAAAAVAVVGAGVSTLVVAQYPNASGIFAHGFLAINLLSWVGMALALVTAVAGAFSSVENDYLAPPLWNLLVPVGALTAVLAGRTLAPDSLGVFLAGGTCAGQLAAAVGLASRHARARAALNRANLAEVAAVLRGGGFWSPLALLAFCSFGVLDSALSSVDPAGVATVLSYGQRVMVAVSGLTNSSLLPLHVVALAGALREGRSADVHRLHGAMSRRLLLSAGILAVVGIVAARPLFHLLFEGSGFGDAGLAGLLTVVTLEFVGLPLMCLGVLQVQTLMVLRQPGRAALLSVLGVVTYVATALLAKPLGIASYGVAYVACWLVAAGYGHRTLGRMLPAETPEAAGAAGRPLLCLAAAVVMGGLCLRMSAPFATAGFLPSALTLVGVTVSIAATALAGSVVLGVWVPRQFLARLAGRRAGGS